MPGCRRIVEGVYHFFITVYRARWGSGPDFALCFRCGGAKGYECSKYCRVWGEERAVENNRNRCWRIRVCLSLTAKQRQHPTKNLQLAATPRNWSSTSQQSRAVADSVSCVCRAWWCGEFLDVSCFFYSQFITFPFFPCIKTDRLCPSLVDAEPAAVLESGKNLYWFPVRANNKIRQITSKIILKILLFLFFIFFIFFLTLSREVHVSIFYLFGIYHWTLSFNWKISKHD